MTKNKKVLSSFLILCIFLSLFSNLTSLAATPIGYITVSVEKFTLGQGYVYKPTQVPFYEGEELGTVIARFLGSGNYNGGVDSDNISYLSSVRDPNWDTPLQIPQYILDVSGTNTPNTDTWLGERDTTEMSFWMFTVNHALSDTGMDQCQVKDGDVVRLQYSVYGYGADLGFGWGGSYITPANKDALTQRIAQINSSANKNTWLLDNNIKDYYDNAFVILENMESEQSEVDSALANLNAAIEDFDSGNQEFDPTDYLNDMSLNQNVIELGMDDTFQLKAKRLPEIVEDDSSSNVVLPDFTYQVNGDSVRIDANGNITPVKLGTSIIHVLYTQKEAFGKTYGAISPVNTGIAVVNVIDKTQTGPALATDIKLRSYDTLYTTENEKNFDFTVTSEQGSETSVQVNDNEIQGNENRYNAPLKIGGNIVSVTASNAQGKTRLFYVIDVRKVFVHIENKTHPGQAIAQGDTALISFDGLTPPVYKMAGIYNPYSMRVSYYNDLLGEVKGKDSQYDISSQNVMELTFYDPGNYTFSSGCIKEGWWGSNLGADRGENTGNIETSGTFCSLPDFTVHVNEKEEVQKPFSVSVLNEGYLHPGSEVTLNITGDFTNLPAENEDLFTQYKTDIPNLSYIRSQNGANNTDELKQITFNLPENITTGTYHLTQGQIYRAYTSMWMPTGEGVYQGAFPEIILNVTDENLTKEDLMQKSLSVLSDSFKTSTDAWTQMEMAALGKKADLSSEVITANYNNLVSTANSSLKGTELSKTAMVLTSLGISAQNIPGQDGAQLNLIDKIASNDSIDGMNGASFALLAYDSGDYSVANKKWTRDTIIQYIKDAQHKDGGWSLSVNQDETSDPDVTAIALSALSPYYLKDNDPYQIKDVVDSAITFLSNAQDSDGTFRSLGLRNVNSGAMVVTALAALGIDADTDLRFVKNSNSAIDGLLLFQTPSGKFGFTDAVNENGLACEQVFRALVSYKYYKMNAMPYNIYNFGTMSDSTVRPQRDCTVSVRVEGINENKFNQVKTISYQTQNITVLDVLKNALGENNLTVKDSQFGGQYISAIFGESEGTFGSDYDGWLYRVNGKAPDFGMDSYLIRDGDEIVVYYGGVSIQYPNEPSITYKDDNAILTFAAEKREYGPAPDYAVIISNVPIQNANVTWEYDDQIANFTTDQNGQIIIPQNMSEGGNHSLQLEKYSTTEVNGKFLPLVVRFPSDYKVNLVGQPTPTPSPTVTPTSGDNNSGGSGSSNITVSFTLIGDRKHESPNKHVAFETWIAKKNITVSSGSTVKAVFEKALKAANIDYVIEGGSYVSSIQGLSEFDNGENSGWMYRINGKHIQTSFSDYILKDGDAVVWHYTDDVTEEENDISHNSGGSSSTPTPTPTPTPISTPTPSSAPDPVTQRFTDVSGWSKDAIEFLYNRKLIFGKTETTFAPKDNITRAEFVAILARVSGADLSKYTETPFSDIHANDWYLSCTSWANENGIVHGYNGMFMPNQPVTRQDLAAMLFRFANRYIDTHLPQTVDTVVFSDESDTASYAIDAVSDFQKAGIVSGRGNNCFYPNNFATREEAAKILAVFLEKVNN